MNKPDPFLASSEALRGESSPPRATNLRDAITNKHLLFGNLAIANGLLRRQTLDTALECWDRADLSLGDYLVEQGHLSDDEREAIEQLVKSQISRRNERSLSETTIESTVTLRREMDTATFTPEVSPQSVLPGELGDYEIIEKIAHGGMGVVYKARQPKLNRVVALKMIRSGGLAHEAQIRRFYAEAEAAAKLDHSGIVPVYEVGESNGQHYFSMAFVDGPSLHAEVKNGPFEAMRAAKIIRAVADAVQFAHENGILHRDLKPQNILLDKQGRPRITDFGLAKHLLSDSQLTETGMVIGTPSFMAPEQAAGHAHTAIASADVYAIGATLYCLMTGRPPFQAASTMETLRQVLETDPVPPRKLNPALPRDLETICLKCLRKEPVSRYASAAAVSADLERWLENKPIEARRASVSEKTWLWCKRRPAVAASIAILLLTAVTALSVVLVQQRLNKVRVQRAAIANDQKRARSHVDNVMTAPAAAMPFAIELLEPLEEYAVPILTEKFTATAVNDRQRLRAAIGLAHFGDIRADFLIAKIADSPDDQCANIAHALVNEPRSIELIRRQSAVEIASPEPEWRHLAKLAIVAISLGDSSIAEDLTRSRPDPSARTVFIDTLTSCTVNLNHLADIVRGSSSDSLRYSVICGLAQVDLDGQELGGLAGWKSVLAETFLNSDDPGIHSACDLAMRRLKMDFPELPDKKSPTGDAWFVNSIGITMLRIPKGRFERLTSSATDAVPQTVFITKPFYLSDRETTIQQYELFASLRQPKNSSDQNGSAKAVGPDEGKFVNNSRPVENASWSDAVQFCNWLSIKEGLEPCYKLIENDCEWDQDANGYRLPTEAEWEYSCRAGATTYFAHGDDEKLLTLYSVHLANETASTGSKLPNVFGLFDMLGNVSEWCFDKYQREYAGEPTLYDPIGPLTIELPTNLVTRVLRGGAHQHGTHSLRMTSRGRGNPSSTKSGFRVARSI